MEFAAEVKDPKELLITMTITMNFAQWTYLMSKIDTEYNRSCGESLVNFLYSIRSTIFQITKKEIFTPNA